MTNAQSEAPFISVMEREPEKWHEQRVTVKASDIFRGDGLMSILFHKIRLAIGMLSQADRGPKDYAESSYERGVRDGAKLGGYHEAPKNGGSASWQKWMLALCGTLAGAGVIGGVAMYGKLSAVEANQISQQKQLDNLAQMVMNLRRSP